MKKRIAKLKWLLNRWQKMVHPAEDVYRLRQFIQNNILDRLQAKPTKGFSIHKSSVSFFNTNIDKLYNVDLKEAFFVFQKSVSITHYDWRTDPKTQTTSPITFKENIDHKDIQVSGENRYVYELNRLHILPALAITAVSNPPKGLQYLSDIIKTWKKENAYLRSINWKSGIEAGIRAINFITARLLLQTSTKAYEIQKEIDSLVLCHYVYLKQHLSLFSSGNNHLLKELLGIIAISSVYEFRGRRKDLSYYFLYYQKELLRQTYEDGGSKEQSIHYHAAVLNASFLVLYFAIKNGLRPEMYFLNRLKAMCIFLDEMTLGGKQESLFGDKDDSNIVYDVFDTQFNLYQSLLTTGKSIFNIDYSYYKGVSNDLLNTLFYMDINCATKTNSKVNKNSYTFFHESGYFIFNSLPLNSKLYFDVGQLGFEPIAAHGHSDLLHFTLWVDNEPFIVDSGTYQYNPHYKKWREYFRGITAHNTISVNRQHHSKLLGVMLWGKSPSIKVTGFGKSEDGQTFCKAEHSAFRNYKGNISHSRKISHESNTIFIEDSVIGKGRFRAEFYLHFHPDVIPQLLGSELILTKKARQIKVFNKLFSTSRLVYGDEVLPLGWYSSAYDYKVKTHALHMIFEVSDTAQVFTEIRFAN